MIGNTSNRRWPEPKISFFTILSKSGGFFLQNLSNNIFPKINCPDIKWITIWWWWWWWCGGGGGGGDGEMFLLKSTWLIFGSETYLQAYSLSSIPVIHLVEGSRDGGAIFSKAPHLSLGEGDQGANVSSSKNLDLSEGRTGRGSAGGIIQELTGLMD